MLLQTGYAHLNETPDTDQNLLCSLHQRYHALALFYCHHKQPAQAMGVWKRYCVYTQFITHTHALSEGRIYVSSTPEKKNLKRSFISTVHRDTNPSRKRSFSKKALQTGGN